MTEALSGKQIDVLVHLAREKSSSARSALIATGAPVGTLQALQRRGLVFRDTRGRWRISILGRRAALDRLLDL